MSLIGSGWLISSADRKSPRSAFAAFGPGVFGKLFQGWKEFSPQSPQENAGFLRDRFLTADQHRWRRIVCVDRGSHAAQALALRVCGSLLALRPLCGLCVKN